MRPNSIHDKKIIIKLVSDMFIEEHITQWLGPHWEWSKHTKSQLSKLKLWRFTANVTSVTVLNSRLIGETSNQTHT